MKLIVLLIGIVIGASGGLWYGVHHPAEAASLSAQEETEFLKAQAAITQATNAKLNALIAKQRQGGGISIPGVGSSLLGNSGGGAGADADLQDLSTKTQTQLNDLQARLSKLGSH